jgi:hypothetical protein
MIVSVLFFCIFAAKTMHEIEQEDYDDIGFNMAIISVSILVMCDHMYTSLYA